MRETRPFAGEGDGMAVGVAQSVAEFVVDLDVSAADQGAQARHVLAKEVRSLHTPSVRWR